MRGHGEATDSMVCGIVSAALDVLAGGSLLVGRLENDVLQKLLEIATYCLVAAGFALGIVAVVLASRSIARDGRSGRAIAGLILGIVGIIPPVIAGVVLVIFAMH